MPPSLSTPFPSASVSSAGAPGAFFQTGCRRKYTASTVHDDCMSKQFVNDVVSIAILATCWHEVPMPPLEGEVPNEREAEGFVRKLSKKTPQSARSGCQLPFQGSQGGFAARVDC